MRKQGQFLSIECAAAFLLAGGLVLGTARAAAQPAKAGDLQPTPVAGESWLQHLTRSFDETSMGKTGRLGPPELNADEEPVRQITPFPRQLEDRNKTVTVHGADLYRMNCRGCHGEMGAGAPPEINSVINPVRATSAVVMRERMKAAGADMSWADATKLAQQSKTMLLDRLHHGGHDMPAFPHLSEAEVNSLVAYLRQLAGVRGAESEQLALHVQRVRVGEHIAKSTCHVCHSAAGPNPTLQQLYEGAIPPLSALPLRTSRTEFIRKVTQGAPIMMGEPPQLLRGRMPVFYYLSEEEAADVYLYLTSYPPYPYAVVDAAAAGTGTGMGVGAGPEDRVNGIADATDKEASGRVAPASFVEGVEPARVRPAMSNDAQFVTLTLLMGLLATLVMGLGFWFTVCELKRLSGSGESSVLRPGAEEKATGRLDPEMAA